MIHYTNKYGVPQFLADEIIKAQERYSKGDADYSVTELMDTPQIPKLLREHDVEQDVIFLWSSYLGTLMHKELDGLQHGISEKRFFIEEDGVTISGQCDLLQGDTLVDYKSMSVNASYYDRIDKYTQQLNLYRYLAWKSGHENINKLKVITMYFGWGPQRFPKEGYPAAFAKEIEIPVWPIDQTRDYLLERIKVHKFEQFCTPEEMWERPTVWKLNKKGRKRSLRNLNSVPDLHQYAKENGYMSSDLQLQPGYYITKETGERVRCSSGWCPVASVCSQWAGYQKGWD